MIQCRCTHNDKIRNCVNQRVIHTADTDADESPAALVRKPSRNAVLRTRTNIDFPNLDFDR
jgi:hypothetical protein